MAAHWENSAVATGLEKVSFILIPKNVQSTVITTNWKILRWEYQTTWPASWETCMQVRKQQLELDMEQKTGSK